MNTRQSKILSYIEKHGEVKNKDLQELVGDCSHMTLWRDLTFLEQEGRIRRTRGGAAPANDPGGREISFNLRLNQNMLLKEEIADIALPLLLPHHSLFLDAGSTVYTLASRLTDGIHTIITSAVNIAAELAKFGNNVTLLGGQVNNDTLSSSGPQAEEMLELINIDVAIMATTGYSVGGSFTGGYLPEAQLKRKILKKSAFSIMLMDSDKIARSHPFTFATLEDFDLLISDSKVPDEFISLARDRGVYVFHRSDGLTGNDRLRVYSELFQKKYG